MEVYYALLAILVVVAIVAVVVASKKTASPKPGRTRKRSQASEDIGSEEDVMNEVEVYLAYGLNDQAIKLLKQAASKFPDNAQIRTRLSGLTR